MLRSYVFEISSDLNLYPLGEINAYTLARDNAGHTCSRFEEILEPADIDSSVCWLKNNLIRAGISIQEFKSVSNKVSAFCFKITQDDKENWFLNSYTILKSAINNMSLLQFASNSGWSSRLLSLINGCCEGAVVSDSVFCTLADFIRSATPGTTYYVNAESVILMG